uniref:Uncharacterized protein n=1 Tax=Archaeoglobus fulgidus TaxID=2234 RepID=A0A7J2THD5_ARCFL
MLDPKKFHFKTGHGSCIVRHGKILDFYLMSEEELAAVEKMLKIFSELLEDIEFGYLEKNDFKFAFFRYGEDFLVFPVREENLAEIQKLRGVALG